MNKKFEIGSKIQITNAWPNTLYKNGEKGIIMRKSNLFWKIDFGSKNYIVSESEMKLIEEPTMENKNIQIKVDPNNPETTRAILRLLSGLGYRAGFCFLTQNHILDKAGWFYLCNDKIAGWDRLNYPPYNDYKTIDTTKTELKAKITTPDGSEIELSNESWELIRETIK